MTDDGAAASCNTEQLAAVCDSFTDQLRTMGHVRLSEELRLRPNRMDQAAAEPGERNADGTITMLVGPDDPGDGNWLDTKGRTETILLARYLLPEGELPSIVTRVVQT